MTTTPEPSRSNNSLTPEEYQEINAALQSENLSQFPSAFQMARNLLKQAWNTGIDVARGQPILTTAPKAAARLEICRGCEFFQNPRCTKCGCFMDKKVHLEASQCPVNKWGAELQRLYPADIAQKNLQNTDHTPLDLTREFSKEDADEIDRLATESLQFDGRFAWKGMQFRAVIIPGRGRQISRLQPRRSFAKAIENHENLSVDDQLEFNKLLLKHQAPDQQKIFAFKSQIFHLTPRAEKGAKPGQFTLSVIDPNNPPPGVDLQIANIIPSSSN